MTYIDSRSDHYCMNHYFGLGRSEELKKYNGINLENNQKIPVSDIVGNEICIYGMFVDDEGNILHKYLDAPKSTKSNSQVLKFGREILGQYLSDVLESKSIELNEFKDWNLTRGLMHESGIEQKLRYLGGISVYQFEPRTPVKIGVVYPSIYSEWVLEEGESRVLELHNNLLSADDLSDFMQKVVVNNPSLNRRICADAVVDSLLSSRAVDKSVKIIENL